MDRTKWEISDLEKAGINSSDREFMARLGLPNLKHDELEFSPDYLEHTFDGTDCHKIGTYGIWNEVPLFVRKTTSGVWTINEHTNELVCVNSSTQAFSRFIGLRQKYLLDIDQFLPVKLREAFVCVIKKAMEEIDSAAMVPEGVWEPFMQDMCNQTEYYGDD